MHTNTNRILKKSPIWYRNSLTRLCLTALVIAHVLAGAFFWFTPKFTKTVAAATITAEQGRAYIASVPPLVSKIYILPSDTLDALGNSSLTLFENGAALGPPHSAHDSIRQFGGGRYSHWHGSIIFSTPDGSDPRVNGRAYTLESPTRVAPKWKIPLIFFLLLADAAALRVFRQEIAACWIRRGREITTLSGFAMLAVTALAAFGSFGTIVIAKGNIRGDTSLAVAALAHACLGVLLDAGMWAAGAGIIRLILRDRYASITPILISAFPTSLVVAALLAAVAIGVPHGRIIALAAWAMCLLPLVYWRPPVASFRALSVTAVGIIPLAVAFGIWMSLLWHGPTATLPGSPSGDLSDYAGRIWSLANQAHPNINLAYANGASNGYFNSLFSAIGAALTPLPAFDPFLFLLGAGGTSYVLLTSLMLFLYLDDRKQRPIFSLESTVLLLAFLAAARYPYWIAESIPVVFVPALTIAVLWMTERGKRDLRWAVAAVAASLGGSILSKVLAAPILVPLAATSFIGRFSRLSLRARLGVFGLGAVCALYCTVMLWLYLPFFLAISPAGPESLQNPKWFIVSRDLATLMLTVLVWLVAEWPVAIAVSFGCVLYLSFAFLTQINFIVAAIVTGLLVYDGADRGGRVQWLALTIFAISLPAAMSDPAGLSSGFAWLICLGVAIWFAILGTSRPWKSTSSLGFHKATVAAALTLAVVGFGLLGVSRGAIIVNSGWDPGAPILTPELGSVWTAVSKLTPKNSLIFTDEVDESSHILGGWNTYALRGQRQIYLSSYVTAPTLRRDRAKLQKVLSINDAVLDGILEPDQVKTQRHFQNFFAVVSATRAVPAGWQKIFANRRYAIFRIGPK